MTEQKVVTPLGFVECTIQVDPKVTKETLSLIRSFVSVVGREKPFRTIVNTLIGEKVTIPLRPGKYRINAVLGELASNPLDINVEDGQIGKVTFYFGKES